MYTVNGEVFNSYMAAVKRQRRSVSRTANSPCCLKQRMRCNVTYAGKRYGASGRSS